jgi:hypothetical protein
LKGSFPFRRHAATPGISEHLGNHRAWMASSLSAASRKGVDSHNDSLCCHSAIMRIPLNLSCTGDQGPVIHVLGSSLTRAYEHAKRHR